MDYKKNIGKIRKIIKLILLTMISLLVIIGFSSYLILHNYINKMNLTNSMESDTEAIETKAAGMTPQESKEDDDGLELFSMSGTDVASSEVDDADGGLQTEQKGIEQSNSESFSITTNSVMEEIVSLDEEIKDNIANNSELPDNSNIMNIMLIGSDTHNIEELGRSNSMILLTINQEKKTIVITSFSSDIYLHIPGKENNRLNAAYTLGGTDLLLQTLQANFKINIDHYIKVDFYSFVDIVDAIGGIKVQIDKDELTIINSYIKEMNEKEGAKATTDCIKKAGTYLLNGRQALCFARNRYTTNGDFDRSIRQREVIETIYQKISSQNLMEMNELLNIILPQVTTDFKESEVLVQFLMVPAYLEYDLEECSVPIDGSYENKWINGKKIIGIDFDKNIKEIYHRLYRKE